MFDPDAGMPKLNRSLVYLGACLIAGIRLARERQVNVRVVPTGRAIEESVDLAHEIFSELAGHKVVLAGTGAMATLVATLLGKAGAQVFVVGRTLDRAREVAQKLGAEPKTWEDIPSLLDLADIVVSSTSASDYVFPLELLAQARRRRHGRYGRGSARSSPR